MGLWSLSILPLFITARVWAGTPALDPAAFGLTVKKLSLAGTGEGKTAVYRIAGSNATLEVSYSPEGRILEATQYDGNHALQNRRRFSNGIFLYEKFGPHRDWVSVRRIADGWDEVIEKSWDPEGGEPKVRVSRRRAEASWSANACAQPGKYRTPTGLLEEIEKLSFAIGEQAQGGAVSLGYNTVARGCENYPGGGVKKLAQVLGETMKTGLSCLLHREDPDRKIDAARIFNLFYSEPGKLPLTIFCGKSGDKFGTWEATGDVAVIANDAFAQAYVTGYVEFPALALNLTALEEGGGNENERELRLKNVLFHESIHLIGYFHSKGKDITYLAANCCISGDQKACALMDSELDVKDPLYYRRFMEAMSGDSRLNIAVDAVLKSGDPADVTRNGTEAASELYWPKSGSPSPRWMAGIALLGAFGDVGEPGKTSLSAVASNKAAAASMQYAQEKRAIFDDTYVTLNQADKDPNSPDGLRFDAAQKLGKLLYSVRNQDLETFRKTLPEVISSRNKVMEGLSRDQQIGLMEATHAFLEHYDVLKLGVTPEEKVTLASLYLPVQKTGPASDPPLSAPATQTSGPTQPEKPSRRKGAVTP